MRFEDSYGSVKVKEVIGCRSPYEIPKGKYLAEWFEARIRGCRSPYEIPDGRDVFKKGQRIISCRSPYEIPQSTEMWREQQR